MHRQQRRGRVERRIGGERRQMLVTHQLGEFHVIGRRARRFFQRQGERRSYRIQRFFAQVALGGQVGQAGNGTEFRHGGR